MISVSKAVIKDLNYHQNDDTIQPLIQQNVLPRVVALDMFPENIKQLRCGKMMHTGVKFRGQLRKEQTRMMETFIQTVWSRAPYSGIAKCYTGFGKTITAIATAVAQRRKTIILVHGSKLAQQWKQSIDEFTDGVVVDILQGKRKVINVEQVDFLIAMLPTLARRESPFLSELFDHFGTIIFDEVHHSPAPTYLRVLAHSRIKYQMGLSATPFARLSHGFLIRDIFGSVVFEKDRQMRGSKYNQIRIQIPAFQPKDENEPFFFTQNRVFRFISKNQLINSIILKNIYSVLQDPSRVVLVLSRLRTHIKMLQSKMPKSVVSGTLVPKMKKEDFEHLKEKGNIIFATFTMAKEALDIKRLNCLILTMDASNTTQAIGRIFRQDDSIPRLIIDFRYHGNQWTEQMSESRRRLYERYNFTML